MLQQSLIILKPDTIGRHLIGEIITRLEKIGLKIIALKMVWPNKEFYYAHYETIGKMITRRGQTAFDSTLTMMISGPVIPIVVEGVDAVDIVRKIVGTTEPKSALPGTIRGDYSHMSFAHADQHNIGVQNLVHASGNIEEANLEIKHRFSEQELQNY